LNQPITVQFINWLGSVLHGDFGWSKTAQMPVLTAIQTYFRHAGTRLMGAVPIIVVGVWLGVQAAVHQTVSSTRRRASSASSVTLSNLVFGLWP
jgi:peptide/nickel transport system permease protein